MIYMLMAFVTGQCINLPSVADSTAVALGSNEVSDRPAADGVTAPQDTIAIITEGVVSDDIYADSAVTTIAPENLVYDPVPWKELGISAGVFTFSSLFVDVQPFKRFRYWVHDQVSHKGKDKTEVDNYLQYVPAAAPLLLYACGYKGDHNFLDKTILLAMSAATFAVLNNVAKYAFNEKRPDSNAHNSFPSGHTGTVVMGAEFMRREYWNTNKWVAMSGYVVAAGVAYLRMHNDRHWINDVIGGAALGYFSTTLSYWLYPKIFRKRAAAHRQELLIRNQRKPAPMVLAAPYVTTGGGGFAVSYTF